LQQLPVEALWGVGPVTAKKLRAIGIEKLVDIRNIKEEFLKKSVGSLAGWLKRLSYGDDPREVKPVGRWTSSSSETTFSEDRGSVEERRRQSSELAYEVCESMKKKNLLARAVTIKVRSGAFPTGTRSHTADPATRDPGQFAARALA